MEDESDNNNPPSIRFTSPVLAAFPWYTDVILQKGKLEKTFEGHILQNYISRVIDYESFVETSVAEEASDMRRMLGLNIPENSNYRTTNAHNDQAKLFGFVSAARLADMSAYMEGIQPDAIPPLHRRLSLETSCDRFVDKLGDWVYAIEEFSDAINQTTANIPAVRKPHVDTEYDVHTRLLKSVARSGNISAAANILLNFDMAALQLLTMLRTENLPLNKLPDIPNNPSDYVASVVRTLQGDVIQNNEENESAVTVAEEQTIQDVIRKAKSTSLRLPIQIAVMVTPVVLLLKVQVFKWNWNRKDLLRFSKSLGNVKPVILLGIERKIFSTLFEIIQGTDTLEAVKKLANEMPWEELAVCHDDIRQWFQSELSPSPEFVDMLTVDLYQDLPPPSPIRQFLVKELGSKYLVQGVSVAQSTGPSNTSNNNALPSARQTNAGSSVSTPSLPTNNPEDNDKEQDGTPSSAAKDDAPKTRRSGRTASRRDYGKMGSNRKKGKKIKREPSVFLGSSAATVIFTHGNVHWAPIDITEMEAPKKTRDFDATIEALRVTSVNNRQSFTGFDALGQTTEIAPVMHHEKSLARLYEWIDQVQRRYENDKPLHIADPLRSVFKVMTQQELDATSPYDVQQYLKTHHIICTSSRATSIKFDRKGLSSFRNSFNVIPICDESISDVMDYSSRIKDGTIVDLATCAQNPKAKIVSASHLPLSWVGWDSAPYSTELVAWHVTAGMPFCKMDLPVSDFHFGAASTTGSLSPWHIEPNGLGMTLRIETGGKYLIAARPRAINATTGLIPWDFDIFADHEMFLPTFFDITDPDHNEFFFEAMYLPASTTVVLRPNTFYMLYTTEHSICRGSYWYSSRLIKDTSYGILHSFCNGTLLGSRNNASSLMMLERIIHFYYSAFVQKSVGPDDIEYDYLPDVRNFDDLLDLFSLCILGIFLNTLDARTYELPGDLSNADANSDINSIPGRIRRSYVYSRGSAIHLAQCICENLIIKVPILDENVDLDNTTDSELEEIDPWSDVFIRHAAVFAKGLLDYNDSVQSSKHAATDIHIKQELLLRQVHYAVGCVESLSGALANTQGTGSIAWQGRRDYYIAKLDDGDNRVPTYDLKTGGLTKGDKLFFGNNYENEYPQNTMLTNKLPSLNGSSIAHSSRSQSRSLSRSPTSDTAESEESTSEAPPKKRRKT